MQKINCPSCNQIIGETDGRVIYIRLPRKNDGITLPFTTGPFIHNACGDFFTLPCFTVIKLKMTI